MNNSGINSIERSVVCIYQCLCVGEEGVYQEG